MTTALATQFDLSKLIVNGDLSGLNQQQKGEYYTLRCQEHGLSAASKPFDYLQLNGKLVLYANKGCAEQLRKRHQVSIKITKADKVDDLFVVIVEAKDASGREDSATGAVNISGLKGDALANAMMKAETKAKRRVTLSICGLNMLDETEVESIKDVKSAPVLNVSRDMQPGPNDGIADTTYRITFGKYKGRTLEEVGADDLKSYIGYLEKKAQQDGKSITGVVAEFIGMAETFIGSFENTVTAQVEPPMNHATEDFFAAAPGL